LTPRARYLATTLFGQPDRPHFHHSFGVMPGVLDRWHAEGLPAAVGEADLRDFFGFDPKPVSVPADTYLYPPPVPRVIEETEEYVIRDEGYGRITKCHKHVSSLPLPMLFPVEKPADWGRLKAFLRYDRGRLPAGWAADIRARVEAGQPTSFSSAGFYAFPRALLGDQTLCLWYYEHPEIIRDMLAAFADLLCALGEEVLAAAPVDQLSLGEDVAYRGGSIVSPAVFREFLLPGYRRVVGLFRARGVKLVMVDTDGLVDGLIPLFLEAWVNLLGPMEVQAGNDIVAYRQQYGRQLAMLGGLNKMVLAKSTAEIDAELERKIPAMLELGGYIPALDHRVIVETPLAHFAHYVRRVKELTGHEAGASSTPDFA